MNAITGVVGVKILRLIYVNTMVYVKASVFTKKNHNFKEELTIIQFEFVSELNMFNCTVHNFENIYE